MKRLKRQFFWLLNSTTDDLERMKNTCENWIITWNKLSWLLLILFSSQRKNNNVSFLKCMLLTFKLKSQFSEYFFRRIYYEFELIYSKYQFFNNSLWPWFNTKKTVRHHFPISFLRKSWAYSIQNEGTRKPLFLLFKSTPISVQHYILPCCLLLNHMWMRDIFRTSEHSAVNQEITFYFLLV